MEKLSKELEYSIKKHQVDLQKSFQKHFAGDDKGISYLSKKEVESLLNDHFSKVETLVMSQYQNNQNKGPATLNVSLDISKIRNDLQNLLDSFIQTLSNAVEAGKQKFIQKITTVKDSITDRKTAVNDGINQTISDVKEFAFHKVAAAALNINDKIKDLNNRIQDKSDQIKNLTDNVERKFIQPPSLAIGKNEAPEPQKSIKMRMEAAVGRSATQINDFKQQDEIKNKVKAVR